MKTKWVALVVVLLTSTFAGHASAQATDAPGWFDNVGSLDFPTSGGPEAQKHFLRGVAVLHSFGWKQAIAEFQMAQELEPDFAMAYWGESLCYNHPLFGERDRESPREVLARLGDTPEERAAKAPTDREKGFLAAVEVLFGDGSGSERRIGYMEAMERQFNAYPKDPEVRAFYALSLLSAAGPLGDTTFRVTVKAGTLALQLFQANPNHPGAAHYTIHAFDDPVHAPLALPAAFRFAAIAPAVSHARHMPSHIFIQRGMWDLVSKSNDSAYEAAVDLWEPGDSVADMVHSLDWGQYGDLERGDFAKARAWQKELDGIVKRSGGESRATRTVPSLKARAMVETEDWKVLDIDEDSNSATLLVSGIAAAKKGDLDTARTAAELLKKRGAREVEDRSTFRQGAKRDQLMYLEVAALVKLAEGDAKAALELFEQGLEGASTMRPPRGPASPVKPLRELYGEALLALDKPEEAAELFEAQLLQTPNRPLSVRGLARAHAAAGNLEAAAEHYRKLIEIREGRNALASVREARLFLAPELSAAEGDYSTDVKVLQRDGSLAAGLPYKLQLNIKGEDPDIETGVIPADGIIRLKGLAGGDGGPSYLLLAGDSNLEAERFELSGLERHRALEFMMAPAPGDRAPDIPLQGLFNGKMSQLSDFLGQYVILDFWATWCPPCYAPMTETEEALRKHADDWKGKAAVVALSIDDTPELAREFVREREWLSMNHYWSSEGEPGFFSDAMRAYRIDNIPTSFLIGPDGTILWRGNAADASSEGLISDALAAGD